METGNDISRREIISAAVAGVKERDTPAAVEVEKPAIEAEKPQVEKPEAEVKPAAELRERDPKSGKFVGETKKGRPTNAEREARLEAVKAALRGEKVVKPVVAEKKEEKKEEAAPVKSKAEPEKPVAATEAAPKTETKSAPGTLKAVMQARWNELAPEWQEEVRRLESLSSQAGSRYGADITFSREMKTAIAPYEHMIAAEGSNPSKAVASLLGMVQTLREGTPEQKANLLQYIATQYQVPLNGQEPDQIMQHPYVRQLAQEKQNLERQQRERIQAQQKQAYENALSQFNAFLAETDNGVPKHPLEDAHKSKLWATAQQVAQENPSWDAPRVFGQAYENLSWTIPELRTLNLQRQEAERKAKAERELAAKRQAAVQVKGAPPDGASSKVDPKDRRSIIKAALRQAS